MANSFRFLLAKLYLNLIQNEINEKRIRKVIERFQNGSGAYDDVYDETMQRIQQQGQYSQSIAQTIFGWVLLSTRALSIPEIQHALAVEVDESEFDETNVIEVDELVSICVGLVTIDAQSNSLKFVHHTTKEYFERKLTQWFPDIYRVLTTTCLTYLSFEAFDSGPCKTDRKLDSRIEEYPFYKYSAQNWGNHYKLHPGDESMTTRFLAAENKIHACSQVIFGFSRDHSTSDEGTSDEGTSDEDSSDEDSSDEDSSDESKFDGGTFYSRFPAIPIKVKEPLQGAHFASFLGLLQPLMSILDSADIKVDVEDHLGRTPLSWAVAYGQEEVCNMLLGKGADPNSMNKLGFTPLFYASVSGRVGIMQSLIKGGAKVDTLDENGRSPLFHAASGDSLQFMLAARGDSLAAVELLLSHGASSTQVDKFGQTPLFAAASKGRESVVKLLIEQNAHLYYAKSPYSASLDPLAHAAMNGHQATAKLLFNAGVSSTSTDGGIDASTYVKLANLLKAGSEGRDDVFKDLRSEGADPNILDSHQRSPLHFAALNGDDTLVKTLIANDADVNAKEAFGRSPLFYAIFGDNYTTTMLLLDLEDIDFQITDIFGDTPMKQAYKRRQRGDTWKLYNLLKVKSGDYEGLIYHAEFFRLLQSPMVALCDACRQHAYCNYCCENCASPEPPRHPMDTMTRYCDYCISNEEPRTCPLCNHSIEDRASALDRILYKERS